MAKKPRRAWVWLVLLALFLWIGISSQREPDHVEAALEHVPEGCEVVGVWRDMEWPEQSREFRPTYILCDDSSRTRIAITVFEGSPEQAAIQELDANYATDGGDVFTVNADGSLTISDDLGEIKTMPPH